MSDLECPACGRSDFKNKQGLKIHHAKAHDERIRTVKECENCGESFEQNHDTQEYCSVKCVHEMQKNRVVVECEYCGGEIERPESHVQRSESHYCSNECRRGESEIRNCAYCGSEVRVRKSNLDLDNHYCDQECMAAGFDTQVKVECAECGDAFNRRKSKSERYNKHFCSTVCLSEYRKTGEEKPCANCGEQVYRTPFHDNHFDNTFCSQACKQEYHTGEDHPSWNSRTVKCWNCEKVIIRKKSRVERVKRNFCDVECMSEWWSWAGSNPQDTVPDKDYPRWKHSPKSIPKTQLESTQSPE